jgi:hypothetical protein
LGNKDESDGDTAVMKGWLAGRTRDVRFDSRDEITCEPGEVVAGQPLDEWEQRQNIVLDL